MPRILSEPEEVEYVTEVAHFSSQENHDSPEILILPRTSTAKFLKR